MESKSHADSEDSGIPKRRIVKRIVRRVPSAAALARMSAAPTADMPSAATAGMSSYAEDKELSSISRDVAMETSSIENPTENPAKDEARVFASLPPLTTSLGTTEVHEGTVVDPKAMILEQLIARRPEEDIRTAGILPQAATSGKVASATKISDLALSNSGVAISSGSAIISHAPMSEPSTPQNEEKVNQISNQVPGISSQGRSSIQSVWPYLAAAKHATEGGAYESSRADLEDDGRSRGYFGWLPWFFVALVMIAGVLGVISFYSGATVIVTPKNEPHSVDMEVATEKDADPQKAIPLVVLTLDESSESDVLAAQSQVSASTPAFGKITVYNSQSSPQTLIKGTRFASPSGKIYKIKSGISVPAAKGSTPGMTVADVYAESPGPSYNVTSKERFTLPGLKSSDRYTKVWGENPEPISGGSDKLNKTLSKDSEESTVDAMHIELQKKLRDRAAHELLSSQVAYETLYAFTYDDPVTTNSDKPGMIHLKVTGHLATPVFDRTDLARVVTAGTLGSTYKGEPVNVDSLEALTFALSEKDKDVIVKDAKAVAFHVTGTANFKWVVDVEKFRSILVNIDKNDFESTVHKISSIKTAEAVLRPFWKQYFPAKTDQIEVKLQP